MHFDVASILFHLLFYLIDCCPTPTTGSQASTAQATCPIRHPQPASPRHQQPVRAHHPRRTPPRHQSSHKPSPPRRAATTKSRPRSSKPRDEPPRSLNEGPEMDQLRNEGHRREQVQQQQEAAMPLNVEVRRIAASRAVEMEPRTASGPDRRPPMSQQG